MSNQLIEENKFSGKLVLFLNRNSPTKVNIQKTLSKILLEIELAVIGE
jgi:hypothetical protein